MPDNRKIITQEEIDAKIAALDNPPEDPMDPPQEQPSSDLPIDNPPADPPVDNPPADNPPADNPPADELPIDDPYRKKFADSTREAQILASKNRKITETIEQAAELPEPTEDELKKEYSDWENLTEFEQKMAKQALASTKKFGLIHQAIIENTKVDAWAKQVDEFVASPANLQKYPDLDGQEAEFRSFAMKESRRGLDMAELVQWFSAISEKPTVKQKGALLNRPNGGGNLKPKPTGLTTEQIAALRKTDQKKYNELVAQGKIKVTL